MNGGEILEWFRQWRVFFFWLIAAALIAAGLWWVKHLDIILIVGVAGGVVIFAYMATVITHFTAVLGTDTETANDEHGWSQGDIAAVHRIIVHGYIVTLMAFVISLLPFVLLPEDGDTKIRKFLEKAPVGVLIGCQTTKEPLVTACDGDNARPQWVLNIGGHVSAEPDKKYQRVDGGLVLPLYLIVIAFMGAAVGLARRLPEYQKRGSPGYSRDYKALNDDPDTEVSGDAPMHPAEVREVVVFQMMQFISAPLVAIAGYALVKPASWESVAILGFASGFSTEAVLLLIRKGVDRVSGEIGKARPPKNSKTARRDRGQQGGGQQGGGQQGGGQQDGGE